MELKKLLIIVLTIISIVLLIVIDCFDVTSKFDYTVHIESTISNLITFISILIGFVSTIYVMLQQATESYVIKLLREHHLLDKFNLSFKYFAYLGFFSVILLIALNFFIGQHAIFKVFSYFTVPITTLFILLSNNLIVTICKMILSEEKLKNKDKKVKKEDLRNL